MNVAIVGAGGIAYSYAAFLAQRGHSARLWSPSGRSLGKLQESGELVARGQLEGAFKVQIAERVDELLAHNRVIIIAVPAYGHKNVMDLIVPHVSAEHTIIVSAHLSFSALYLSQRLNARGLSIPIVVWNTTASTGRRESDSNVFISKIRNQVEMAVLPKSAELQALNICGELFGLRFLLKPDPISVDIGNLNPLVHLAIVMFNLTRIEKAETWLQQENMTGAVCSFMEELDKERLNLATALGVSTRTIQENYAKPGETGVALVEMIAQAASSRKGVTGPKQLSTRYVTEDVPFGLVPTVMLGKMMRIPMPLHEAGIAVLSATYGVDFSQENTLLPEMVALFDSPSSLRNAGLLV